MKGHVRERGAGHWYAVIDNRDPKSGARKRKWHSLPNCTGKRQAQVECARLVSELKGGTYLDPSKLTVGQWIDQWIEAGAPGRRQKKPSQRTLERYGQLLRTHIKPAVGSRLLQKLQASEIDKRYADMAEAKTISPRTQHHVHIVFGACLATAHRKGLLLVNPMTRVEQIPNPDGHVYETTEDGPDLDDDIGEGLTEAELRTLVAGFETTNQYSTVVLAAATGARRNELLALRWTDLDIQKKTLRIERALEQTKKFKIRIKPPKTKRGLRTIDLDDATIAVLLKQKDRLLRIMAGIPKGVADVDLSLVRLPGAALMFPALFGPGRSVSFTTPRDPRNFSREFADRVGELGFSKTRFHDLRGIHSTALLDAGIPVHTVAQRIGDDPATLLRSYTKRKRLKQADEKLSSTITQLAAGFLGAGTIR
ncbi:site-specific integrase [Bradyrhizobium sp. CCGB12]|uniref:tyrosine-type recombinase/integrase n=1 Tax=Bradyrhizobium sp. CCGB12 TaxID=2949632 RepID=UPI0020B34C99|nr:site-specific integrase [Bradyrhizobium sp. CCGB12]MCP3388839.1 site-specific integrase [Bradyrhizobium sp. CCGB12]